MPRINSIIITENLKARFWAKVKKTKTCWLWIAAIDDHGYGRIFCGETGSGCVKAHALSYVIHHGSVPDGLIVCHNCPGGDNPACIHPDHLYAGTYSQNITDTYSRGTKRTGEKLHKRATKLNEMTVRKIFACRKKGLSYAAIAKMFGIHHDLADRICTRKAWTWVSGLTEAENKKISYSNRHRSRGHHPIAKLNKVKAQKIRQKYKNGSTSLARLAAEYSVSTTTILRVIQNKVWV